MMIDWDNATVKIKVPVHATETVEMQEIEIHIRQLADLIAGQFSYSDDRTAYVKGSTLPLLVENEDYERWKGNRSTV